MSSAQKSCLQLPLQPHQSPMYSHSNSHAFKQTKGLCNEYVHIYSCAQHLWADRPLPLVTHGKLHDAKPPRGGQKVPGS